MMILLGKSGIIQLIYSAEVKKQIKLNICSCCSQLNCKTTVNGVWEWREKQKYEQQNEFGGDEGKNH